MMEQRGNKNHEKMGNWYTPESRFVVFYIQVADPEAVDTEYEAMVHQ